MELEKQAKAKEQTDLATGKQTERRHEARSDWTWQIRPGQLSPPMHGQAQPGCSHSQTPSTDSAVPKPPNVPPRYWLLSFKAVVPLSTDTALHSQCCCKFRLRVLNAEFSRKTQFQHNMEQFSGAAFRCLQLVSTFPCSTDQRQGPKFSLLWLTAHLII